MEIEDECWELKSEERESEEDGGAEKEMMKMKVMKESESGAVGAPLEISLKRSLSHGRLEREIETRIRKWRGAVACSSYIRFWPASVVTWIRTLA